MKQEGGAGGREVLNRFCNDDASGFAGILRWRKVTVEISSVCGGGQGQG